MQKYICLTECHIRHAFFTTSFQQENNSVEGKKIQDEFVLDVYLIETKEISCVQFHCVINNSIFLLQKCSLLTPRFFTFSTTWGSVKLQLL